MVAVDDLAVADLVVKPADGVDPGVVVPDPQRRLLRHLHLGHQVAARCLPPGGSRCRPPCERRCGRRRSRRGTAPAATRRPTGDVDTRVVLGEARHLAAVEHLHRQLGDPAGHDPLDPALPDPQRVGVARREVADVQHGAGQRHRLGDLPLGGSGRRRRAGPAPRSCGRGSRRRASRPARGRDGARRSPRPPAPTPVPPPASCPSDRRRRSPPCVPACPSRAPLGRVGRRLSGTPPGLFQAPRCGVLWRWRGAQRPLATS